MKNMYFKDPPVNTFKEPGTDLNGITYEKLTIRPGQLVYLERMKYREGKNFQTFTHFHEMFEIIFHKKITGTVKINDKNFPIRK